MSDTNVSGLGWAVTRENSQQLSAAQHALISDPHTPPPPPPLSPPPQPQQHADADAPLPASALRHGCDEAEVEEADEAERFELEGEGRGEGGRVHGAAQGPPHAEQAAQSPTALQPQYFASLSALLGEASAPPPGN